MRTQLRYPIEEETEEFKKNNFNIKIIRGNSGGSNSGGTPIKGEDGASAYEIAKRHGFVGTEQQWLESLKGADGQPGPQGEVGPAGPPGNPGVYIGEEAPQDPTVKVWIDTDEQDDYASLVNEITERINEDIQKIKNEKADIILQQEQGNNGNILIYDGANNMPFNKINIFYDFIDSGSGGTKSVEPIDSLESNKMTFIKTGFNLLNKDTITKNVKINPLDGTLEESQGWITSDFFIVNNQVLINWLGKNSDINYQIEIAFYSKDKVFIESGENEEEIIVTNTKSTIKSASTGRAYLQSYIVPSEAYYARVSYIDTQYNYMLFSLFYDSYNSLNFLTESQYDFILNEYHQPDIIDILLPEKTTGILELISGKLKIYRKVITLNSQNIIQIKKNSLNGFECTVNYQNNLFDKIGNIEEYQHFYSYINLRESEFDSSKKVIYIYDQHCETETDLRNRINQYSLPLIIYFKEGEEEQIFLQNHDIKTFFLCNYIFCVGAMGIYYVEYYADTKAYINEKIPYFSSALVSDVNIFNQGETLYFQINKTTVAAFSNQGTPISPIPSIPQQ